MIYFWIIFIVAVIALILYFLIKGLRPFKEDKKSTTYSAYSHDVVVDRTVKTNDDELSDWGSALLINELLSEDESLDINTDSSYDEDRFSDNDDNEIKFGGGETGGGGAGGSWGDSSYDDYDSGSSFDDSDW